MGLQKRNGALFALLFAANMVLGQPPEDGNVDAWVTPQVMSTVRPTFPRSAVKEGRGGWARLSFIVTKAGRVEEPMIESSSGGADIEQAAIVAVRRWRYWPATRNGEAIDHPMTEVTVRFWNYAEAASKEFIQSFAAIDAALAKGDLVEAQRLFEPLAANNDYEITWRWWLRFRLLAATKTAEREELIDCLTRALGNAEEYFTADLFVAASAQLFALQVETNDFGGAIEEYERLQASDYAKSARSYKRTLALLTDNVDAIKLQLEKLKVLPHAARIDANGTWWHRLAARSFEVGEVTGDLRFLEVRCEHTNVRFEPVVQGRTLTVPATWKRCGAYVRGDTGSTFKLYEYPSEG